mgnify:CR=1 FL=1
MNPARLRAYLMLLVVAVIWGIASPVIKYTLGGFDPLTFLTYRFGISSIISIVIFLIIGFIALNWSAFYQHIVYLRKEFRGTLEESPLENLMKSSYQKAPFNQGK